jgi:hypothetical protein
MTGETLPRTMKDYVSDFEREGQTPRPSFFEKWGLLIKLPTGVHLLEIQGMEAIAAACVAAQRCRELTSGPSAPSPAGPPTTRRQPGR